MADLKTLEVVLGHQFADAALLRQALTHPSVSGDAHYQRLEFLGDRILGAIIATQLYRRFPDMNEGDLALRYNALVRKETLATIAKRIDLATYMVMSGGEEDSGGRAKPAILADVCEAIIGALYLDGGIDMARTFVLRYWDDLLEAALTTEKDPKTTLQEWAQARGFGTPRYKEVERTGPSHAPRFTIRVSLQNGQGAQGIAGSKRGAEQDAARTLLSEIDLLEKSDNA